VGGQRSERRKWIHCFADVKAVIFCAALSDYNQKLVEDETTNRMKESITLFQEICNISYLEEAAIILFLNKQDVFVKRIKKVSLKFCFPDYNGDDSFESCVEFIVTKFAQNLKDSNLRRMSYYVTCATDTSLITPLFSAVKANILKMSILASGL